MSKNNTVGKILLDSVDTIPKKNAMGWIKNDKIKFYNFKKYFEAIELIALGLLKLGLKTHDKLAILSLTRKEWNLFDHAGLSLRATIIPIYPSYLSKNIKYIIDHSESTILVVENQEQFEKLITIQDNINIKTIIYIDKIGPEIISKIKKIKCISYDELIKLGKNDITSKKGAVRKSIESQKGSDLASIIYTSGTTGEPKGAVITQHAFASMLINLKNTLSDVFTTTDRTLIFLPLSHVLGRCDSMLNIIFGLEGIYAEGMDKIIENIGLTKPTVLIAVPRIFEKIYDKILTKINNGPAISKALFKWSLKVSNTYYQKIENQEEPTLADTVKKNVAYKVVFSKIYNRFGGKIRYFVSGGAPIAPEIIKFLRNAELKILEGYGLTETIAPCVLNPIKCQKPGAVGKPLQGVELSFASDGEILIKTEAMFASYYKNETATSQAIKDGWFHTGDIGVLTDDGYLKITDRKKDIIITSAGKNIAPQPIENKMKLQNFITHFMVVGDQKKFLTGIVGIEKEAFLDTLPELKLKSGVTIQELAGHPEVRTLIKDSIDSVNEKLAKFETIKDFIIAPEEFSIENGMLTPSLKLKKKVILNKFKEEVDTLYQTLS